MSETPRIAVVVVTYNSAGVLAECLRSLAAGARGADLVRVVVADNASRDESVPLAERAGAMVVPLGRNAGYAAGINAGIAALDREGHLDRVDAVAILNPDCRTREGALARLAAALHAAPGRGIAVPRLVSPDGHTHPSLRRAPTVRGALAEAVLGGRLADRVGRLGEVITDPRRYRTPGAAAWATGAALLVSVAAVRDLGPWDESFLLYSEETEFALRAADRGWALWYEPEAVVEHIGGEANVNPVLAALLTTNRVRLFRRRRGPVASFAFYLAVVLGEALRTLAGRRTARASLAALLRPSRRMRVLPQ
ncbi:glycosyltransferase family 2 protein [Microbispora hainanensis]|uniref:Glycosyltransferase family 2 protein n=1 Tax=Microbispora hainanensis TaxID=568844 RepID=A0A544YTX1_9ACTN|nr:glycosyltransferase [Microbispora hainanensis]TQS20209.1 glycosyltransferase family 2 protein [Microbispora hainanensis]